MFGFRLVFWIEGQEVRSFIPKLAEIDQQWFVVDADGLVLGRLASRIASILMGKEKPIYTDFLDCGDFVVVVNAEKVRLTGKKKAEKMYYRHSGYPGGIKKVSAGQLLKNHPDRVLKRAVKGMLPKTKLGNKMFSKLKVYAGPEHPHSSQQPQLLDLYL